MAGLPVRFRQKDLAMQPLHRPTMRDKSRSQIIQQFRMRGLLPLRTEVAGGGNQGLAEVPVPNAIHDHSCGQWGRIGKDSLSQLEPARALFESAVAFGEHRQKLPRSDFTRGRYVAV